MKEINLASVVIAKRKEKKITQDELANYLGVSKAAISKWETAQSYPDITLLPHIATFFNITIDELIGYSPQMDREEIKRTYHRLSAEFAKEEFDVVHARCNEIISRYYSCFPLMLQMGILLINHAGLAGSHERCEQIVEEAAGIFERIRIEGDDVNAAKQALFLEAYCMLIRNKPQDALILLEGTEGPPMSSDGLFSRAYQMLGMTEKAKEKTQMEIYNSVILILNAFPMMFTLNADSPEKLDECVERAMAMDKVFEIRKLHPAILLPVIFSAAATYVSIGMNESALDMIEDYTAVASSAEFPYRLKGDSFFDMIDGALEALELGTDMVRNAETVKESIISTIADNQVFEVLHKDIRFKNAVSRLKSMSCS